MARKRKSDSIRKAIDSVGKSPEENSKLYIRSYEDVADSEDEFHIGRDKILLEEEPARKKQRQLEEQEAYLQGSDEEVLDLPSSGSEDEEYNDDEYEYNEVAAQSNGIKTLKADLADSDPETEEEKDLNAGGWGASRRDYYDADAIETEQDALEEEEEALRLQKKQLAGMTGADFGFDEAEWLKADEINEPGANVIVEELLPQIEVTEEMPAEERESILASRYPEFTLLKKEYLALQTEYEKCIVPARQALEEFKPNVDYSDQSVMSLPESVLRWTALSTYLAALSMYFAILTSGPINFEGKQRAKAPIEMQSHPIMASLMQARTTWEKAKAIEPSETKLVLADPSHDKENDLQSLHKIYQSADGVVGTTDQMTKRKKRRKSKAEKAAEAALVAAAEQRAERLKQTEASLAAIAARARGSSHQPMHKIVRKEVHDELDLGEAPTSNVPTDKRKKSLAFYTSQIAQKAARRNVASQAAGGDDDIPYRERFRDRQARLNAEAEARGKKGRDVLGQDDASDDEDRRIAAELRASAAKVQDNGDSASSVEGEEDYYQTIASRTAAKKADKAARAAAHAEARLHPGSRVVEEVVNEDGKRGITYAIEKNKGLTPRRKKEVRNPRVKKRKRFEEKMKKLGNIKQLYKPEREGRGGYGGERTGIKGELVRSVKL